MFLAKFFLYFRDDLSEDQYSQLGKICDEIISNNLSSKSVVAQDFLHISRYSPAMAEAYIGIHKKNVLTFFIHTSREVFRSMFHLIKYFFKSVTFQNINVSSHEKKPNYLIISHYTGDESNLNYTDSYFGEVIKELNKSKCKIVVAYINHTNHKPKVQLESGQKNIILPINSINLSKLFEIYKESFFSLFEFNQIDDSAISKRLSVKARFNLFSPNVVRSKIIANHVKRLVTELSPKYVMTTYEGYAWEKLCFSLARESMPSIKCIAYQHAPIFKYQHAIRRGIGGGYDPDIILTSGDFPKSQLLKCESLRGSKILLLGSGRALPESLILNKNNTNINTCLVVPEGEITECEILFGFALECARKIKNVNFIWRFPPRVDLAMLQNLSTDFENLAKNITISTSSLASDINASNYVLYRGSSVVIQAVLSGSNPIYFMQNNELSMDPLFSYQENKRIASDALEFEGQIQDGKSVSEELKAHCKNIYSNININILKGLI